MTDKRTQNAGREIVLLFYRALRVIIGINDPSGKKIGDR